jgi:glutamate racemase
MRGAVRNASASAIGVFDSGVGGLSVLRHIRAQLPSVPLLYVADSGHVPYGDKTQDYIRERALVLTEFLVRQGAATVVIACNTATAAAAGPLRARFDLPIVAMEPAVKPAVSATRSGVVGVLATVGTRELVARYVRSLLERGADTIVLGCTHYPFLKPLVTEVVGPGVQLIDTGEAVARQVVRRLPEALIGRIDAQPTERFWTTGDRRSAARTMSRLWGRAVDVTPL